MEKQLKEIIRSVLREEFISELSKNDIHVKEIMKFYDKGTYSTKKAVSIFVSGKPNATRNQILDDLADMGYNDAWEVMDHFKLTLESTQMNEGFGDTIKKIRNLAIKMASTKYDRAKSHMNLDKIASADKFDGKDAMNKATSALLQQSEINEDLKSVINKIAVKLGTGSTMLGIITALVSMSGWIQYLDSSFTKWYYTEIQKLAEPQVMQIMQDLGKSEGSFYGKLGMYAFFIFFTIAVISLVAARMTQKPKNESEDFKARSKETGKLVHFKSKDSYQNALKTGTHEDPDTEKDSSKEEPVKGASMFAGDAAYQKRLGNEKPQTTSEPQKVTSVPKLTDKVKQKIEKWTEKEKAFFDRNEGAPGSEFRRSLGQTLKDKAKGALKAIKKGFKHEVEEFKDAGKGVQNFFSGKPLSEHEQKAVKAVAFKVVTTALFGAALGGTAHGAAYFAKHVAMEFIPHVVGETILKGIGKAAVFADAEGEAEMDANMIKFTELIADGLEKMEITPEMMEKMVDSYNQKKVNKGDVVPGGLAKGLSLNDIAEKHGVSVDIMVAEFKKGIAVEMEHTTDREVAKEITLDHLFEDPKYYDKLKKVEEYVDDKGVEHVGAALPQTEEEPVNESTNPSDIIKDLDKAKNDLLKKVDVLISKKKKLYSNVDIESPMSADEKKLDKDIADLFSQINTLVLQKRKVTS
jgi:hypothetical protein